uniref:Nesprin-1 n=1 Tax=Phallusia mammillata TaxID=59560 RepID=A0A6F9DUV5_9ASCI|nr:nesprin-1 [Phallusia mammillata]
MHSQTVLLNTIIIAMFSPEYFAKQSAYVESLHNALEVALNGSCELANEPNARLKICNDCQKPQLFYSESAPNSPCAIKRHLDFDEPKVSTESPERDKGTYVTAVMNTLINTRSPNSSYNESLLNESSRSDRQELPISHKQFFLHRRPSMRAENSRSKGSPAKDFRRSLRLQRNTVPLVESPNSSKNAIETPKSTSGLTQTDVLSGVSPLVDNGTPRLKADRPGKIARNSSLVKGDYPNGSNPQTNSSEVRKDCTSKQDIYYTLSPLLLDETADKVKPNFDSPYAKSKDKTDFVDAPCAKPMEGVCEYASKTADPSESDSCSESSSSATSTSSGRPEYFAVIKKGDPKRKRDKSRDRSMSFGTSFGRHSNSFHSTHAQVMSVLGDRTNIPSDSNQEKPMEQTNKTISSSVKSTSINQVANLHIEATRNLTETPTTPKLPPPETPNIGYASQMTTPGHEPGLLSFSNVFELGDVSGFDLTDSYVEETDFMKDGYCQCSYCNRNEDIFTSTQLKDWSHEDALHEATHCSRHKPRGREFDTPLTRADLQSPQPIEKKPYKRSPEYQVIMDLFCQCRKQADIDHEALQLDIEKHSTGVASVLNLCEVLLHDGDACATETERQSIEEATKSLDRRWRNICALSMERRLKVEDTQRLWQKFLSDFARFGEWLHECELTSANPNTLCVAYKVAREELRTFEAFQRKVHEGLTQLELINKQYRRLARENRTDTSNKLKQLVHDGNMRWDALSRRVSGILRRLKYAIERRESFEAQREALLVWLTETDLQLTNLEHFSPKSSLEEKMSNVKLFQAKIEERIPLLRELDQKGRLLIEKSEEHDCVAVEEELEDFHKYCWEVISRLDRYHNRLLRLMHDTEMEACQQSLFDDSELQDFSWWTANCLLDGSDVSNSESENNTTRDLLATPTGGSSNMAKTKRDKCNGRTSPHSIGSLEWDHYDISQSEIDAKLDDGDLTGDESISDLSPDMYDEENTELEKINLDSDSKKSSPEPITLKSNLAATTRSRPEDSNAAVDSAPPKRRRQETTKQDQKEKQRARLEQDLDAVLAWLDATSFPSTESVAKIETKVKELKTLQKEIEARKPIVLSINLVAARLTDDAVYDKTAAKSKLMRDGWKELNANAHKRKVELQKMFVRCEDVSRSAKKLRHWIEEQEKKREELAAVCRFHDSPVPVSLQMLRKAHKALIQLRVETLEERVKIASLQEISNQLFFADGRYRTPQSPPVEGAAETSDRLDDIADRLKSLLDRVGEDIRVAETALKEERGRMRGSVGSNSETDSVASEVSLHSTTSMKLKKLRRKVDDSKTMHRLVDRPVEIPAFCVCLLSCMFYVYAFDRLLCVRPLCLHTLTVSKRDRFRSERGNSQTLPRNVSHITRMGQNYSTLLIRLIVIRLEII